MKSILQMKKFVAQYALNFIFVVAFVGVSCSLYFSEVKDFPPCDLCWYQRILFYPIFIIAILGLVFKDKGVFKYIMTLAVLGFPISLYHHLLKVTDLFPKQTPFCNTEGACAGVEWQLIEGSGITIPFLAMLGFGAIIILCGFRYLVHHTRFE